jgi:hypothetical protein
MASMHYTQERKHFPSLRRSFCRQAARENLERQQAFLRFSRTT